MIFARDVDGTLTSLVKKIDEETGKNKGARMGSFVVFCSDDKDLENKLKAMSEKEGLKHIVLAIDNPAGPKGYKVEKDADVTVVLYTNRTVKANYAFKKGEMKEADVQKILADLPKILQK